MAATIHFKPEHKSFTVREGTTVLQAALKNRVPIRTRCGGYAGCLMCKVRIEPGSQVTPATDNELRKLGALADEGWRLACQTKILGDTTAEVPEDPLKAAVRAQLAKQKELDNW